MGQHTNQTGHAMNEQNKISGCVCSACCLLRCMSPQTNVDSFALFFTTLHITHETKQKLSADLHNDLAARGCTGTPR
jgi:hypothetical protein